MCFIFHGDHDLKVILIPSTYVRRIVTLALHLFILTVRLLLDVVNQYQF